MHPQQSPQPQLQMRRIGRIGIFVAVLAVAFLVWNVLAAHRASAKLAQSTAEEAVTDVSITHPQAQGTDTELVLPGTVQANFDAPIYAQTSGYLQRWLVDIGAHVKAGQLLAVIDTPEVEQQMQQARADLATAAANEQIAAVTATRWRELRRTDSVAQQDADEKISLAAQAKAQVASARANLNRLQQLMAFRRIVAPFDGIITARNTDIGQLIVAGSNTGPELFRISDEHQLRLYVHVPQAYAGLMTSGLTAQVSFPDRPAQMFPAKLDSTSSAIDPATNTLLVQLLVNNSKGELLPGAYADVHFQVPPGTLGLSLKLPANVLLFRSDGIHVATVGPGGHVVLKPVVIGRDYGSAIEIVHGLSASDDVILSPPDSLIDNDVVRVVQPAAAAAAGPAPAPRAGS